jgi:hypothetical protein
VAVATKEKVAAAAVTTVIAAVAVDTITIIDTSQAQYDN